jgi:hypothetical protein
LTIYRNAKGLTPKKGKERKGNKEKHKVVKIENDCDRYI